jgi:hypothetical protein
LRERVNKWKLVTTITATISHHQRLRLGALLLLPLLGVLLLLPLRRPLLWLRSTGCRNCSCTCCCGWALLILAVPAAWEGAAATTTSDADRTSKLRRGKPRRIILVLCEKPLYKNLAAFLVDINSISAILSKI